MKIHETQELEDLIEAVQPGNDCYKYWSFHNVPKWAKACGLGYHGLRLLMWISETAIWCDSVADKTSPHKSLRSLPMQAMAFRQSRYNYIYDVHKLRYSYLYSRNKLPKAFPKSLIQEGQLLVFFPDMNLADGAAAVQTDGYFEGDNLPPWDTWIDYFEEPIFEGEDRSVRKYLVAWVPPVFVEQVQEGIRVNPEKCIQWLEDSHNVFSIIWEDLSYVMREACS